MDQETKTRLIKLLNMVSSDSDGEAVTAARLALKLAEETGG